MSSNSVKFGKEIREKEFLLDATVALANHGSYGTVPRSVREHQMKLQTEMESCPDHWFRRTSQKLWKENLQAACDFVGANIENMVFVLNATTGMNAAIKSISFKAGDVILATDQTYNAVKKICLQGTSRLEDVEVTFMTIPIESHEAVVSKYREQLAANKNIKLAVIDHISSAQAIKMPVKELIDLCHEHDVLVAVDGAHAPGQVPLSLEELGADFYTGNFHKWLFTPRGCALLWVHPKHHSIIRPAVTSHCWKEGLHQDFFLQGTNDETSYYCVEKSIKFYNGIGGMDVINKYNSGLLDEVVEHFASLWKTRKWPIAKEMKAPCMRLVQLPDFPNSLFDKTDNGAVLVMRAAWHHSKVVCLVVCLLDELWLRLSAQVYNSWEDYNGVEKFVEALRANEVTYADEKQIVSFLG